MVLRDRVRCASGLEMSIQASSYHYCSPREDDFPIYNEVEIGFPSKRIEDLMPYAEDPENPTETVYGYVPSSLVLHIIKENGGIVLGDPPPMSP